MGHYKEKIYECCICHKLLKNVDTCKIVKWSYDRTRINRFNQAYMQHFCRRCMSKIDNWIRKHSEENYEKQKI